MTYATTAKPRLRHTNGCDLCGVPTEARYDGSEFGIVDQHGKDGRVCGQCREELRQERAVTRWHKLAQLSIGTHNERKCVASRVYHLPVLNPDFAEADLTARAACRILVAETRKRERRAG